MNKLPMLSTQLALPCNIVHAIDAVVQERASCFNCQSAVWAAKNDRFCTDCEHTYSTAFARSQYISKITGTLYSVDEDDVIAFSHNRWVSSDVTPTQLRHNSNFKSTL